MYTLMKIIFTLLAAILLTGCRTARPTVMSEESTDSVKIFTNTSLSISHDSIIISENIEMLTDEIVKFVEGGGSISVSFDGSLVMSGVASVHSSTNRASSAVEENVSSNIETQRKDSLSISRNEESFSDTHVKDSATQSRLKWSGIISAIIFLMLLIIIIRRIRGK